MQESAGTMKKLSMELGGNAPFIVFNDADIDAAIDGAMISKYRNTGQTCVCTNRFFVQSGVYDEFCQKLVAAVEKMKIGNGLEGETQQGPMIDMSSLEKVEEHVQDAVAKGGKLLTGGKRHSLGGTFYEPAVIADANETMLVAREETFAGRAGRYVDPTKNVERSGGLRCDCGKTSRIVPQKFCHLRRWRQ